MHTWLVSNHVETRGHPLIGAIAPNNVYFHWI